MYTWLCFGIAISPGVFQRPIQGIPKTVAFLDNILISEQIMEEQNSNLHAVLRDYKMLGSALELINMNSKSCRFHTYVIGLILKGSIQLNRKSMQFTKDPPQRMCRNCKVFFLAFVNYYHRYLSNISTFLASLYKLLQK